VCEKAAGSARSCDFRSGKVILQQPIEPEQMRKLLATGRTDLLRGFVSNRTRRKFAAFLVRKADGTIGFEFEPRAPKAQAAAQTAAGAARRSAKTPPAAEEPAPAQYAAQTAKRPTAKRTAQPAARASKAQPKPAAKRAAPSKRTR
jgi:DNA topoisomerase-3